MNIFVGRLPYQITEEELTNVFSEYGQVASVKIVKDWTSGESKGFAFIEMPIQVEAETAIKKLNDSELNGRTIKVNIARDKNKRPFRPRRY